MAGQFELGTKHLECMKLASQNLSEAGSSVSAMLQKTYGYLPSESQVYDDYLGLAVAIEEIAKTSPETASIISDQVVIREIFKAYGNANAKAILESNATLGILCSEPGNASINSISTKATRNNGEWTITGVKHICNEQLSAENYIIFAQDEEGVARLFVISKSQITVNTIEKTIASSKVSLCQANINVTLSESSHVGDITDEFEFVQTVARTLIAAASVGIAHSALLASISVGKEVKNAEGQALSQSQNIQFTLADMFAEIEASRMLTYLSANSIDEKKASIKYATMAKVKASDIAAKSSVDALHILGNIGYVANTDFSGVIMRAVEGQVKGGTNRTQMSQIYQYMLAKK